MTSDVTMQVIGDWNGQMAVPINNALAASIDMTGRSGRQACLGAMVMMAQSARAMTQQSKKNRKIKREGRQRYFETEPDGRRVFEWWWKSNQTDNPWVKENATFEDARRIKNRGLAKRSWMWGIASLTKTDTGKPIPHVSELDEIIQAQGCGFILTNRLSYITSAAPADVEQRAAERASNRIMATAAKRLEQRYGVTVARLAAKRAKRRKPTLQQSWRAAA